MKLKVLLPCNHPYIKIKPLDNFVKVTMTVLSWLFPQDASLTLPFKKPTTKSLAEYIATVYWKLLENDTSHLNILLTF
ncbi:MAG: hypothetical protein LBC02_07335 [Planctomycetaceae bacterium]|nr:hypothetical protein [Planctomycetaceae bacterium]